MEGPCFPLGAVNGRVVHAKREDLRRHGDGKIAAGTCPRWLMAPFALGSLGVKGRLRHRSFLEAVAVTVFDVAARSWEPWFEELVMSPFALGSLGVKSFLPYRSLFYLASLGLLSGPCGGLFRALLGPFWASLGPLWDVLGPFWAVTWRLGGLGPSWSSLEAA